MDSHNKLQFSSNGQTLTKLSSASLSAQSKSCDNSVTIYTYIHKKATENSKGFQVIAFSVERSSDQRRFKHSSVACFEYSISARLPT